MDYDTIVDILIANKFGRIIKNNFYSERVNIIPVGNEFILHLNSTSRSPILDKLFQNISGVDITWNHI